jgi:hypothetical protein
MNLVTKAKDTAASTDKSFYDAKVLFTKAQITANDATLNTVTASVAAIDNAI